MMGDEQSEVTSKQSEVNSEQVEWVVVNGVGKERGQRCRGPRVALFFCSNNAHSL
jgi:hypothetical protein